MFSVHIEKINSLTYIRLRKPRKSSYHTVYDYGDYMFTIYMYDSDDMNDGDKGRIEDIVVSRCVPDISMLKCKDNICILRTSKQMFTNMLNVVSVYNNNIMASASNLLCRIQGVSVKDIRKYINEYKEFWIFTD